MGVSINWLDVVLALFEYELLKRAAWETARIGRWQLELRLKRLHILLIVESRALTKLSLVVRTKVQSLASRRRRGWHLHNRLHWVECSLLTGGVFAQLVVLKIVDLVWEVTHVARCRFYVLITHRLNRSLPLLQFLSKNMQLNSILPQRNLLFFQALF